MFGVHFIDIFLYVITGAFAGFSAGLLGIGGGLVIVPVLYFVFSTLGYEPQQLMHMALATSLATIVVTSISSTRAHHKKKAVLWPIVFLMSPGIILGAWSGVFFSSQINTDDLRAIFSVFEFFVAFSLLLNKRPGRRDVKINKILATIGGYVIGLISAIVGIGGATLTVPFLNIFNIHMRNAVATSAACGFPIALIGTLSFIYISYDLPISGLHSIGYLQYDAFIFIAISSYIAAPLGALVAHSIPEKALRQSFSALLFILAIIMLLK